LIGERIILAECAAAQEVLDDRARAAVREGLAPSRRAEFAGEK